MLLRIPTAREYKFSIAVPARYFIRTDRCRRSRSSRCNFLGTRVRTVRGDQLYFVLPVLNLLKWLCIQAVSWWAPAYLTTEATVPTSSCSKTVQRMETHTLPTLRPLTTGAWIGFYCGGTVGRGGRRRRQKRRPGGVRWAHSSPILL